MISQFINIKPPKILGGFFVFFVILLFSITVNSAELPKVNIWVNVFEKAQSREFLIENGAVIKYYSNWLNSYFIEIERDKIALLKDDKRVKSIQNAHVFKTPEPTLSNIDLTKVITDDNNLWFENFSDIYYKQYLLSKQIHLLNYFDLNSLPKVKIGIIDGGFKSESILFDSVNIVEQRNFSDEFETMSIAKHGTSVLSLVAGNKYRMVKTSGKNCDIYLAKTEVDDFEKSIEEFYLVQALEWMVDTLGVELINISLGYSYFDDEEDHYIEQFNGDSTIAAKAVNAAFKRGASLFCSAGNEGDKVWKYITTPADAFGSMTIGAVDVTGSKADFSSFGYDGFTIKPDVMDCGVDVTVYDLESNGFSKGSGTSYASPIALGTAILLKRINPTISNIEIYKRIHESASQYNKPDYTFGYGVINSLKAICDSTTFSGFVYNGNSIPLNNCKVIIGNDSVFTKSDGFWFYKNENVATSNRISFMKHGYQTLHKNIQSKISDSTSLIPNHGVVLHSNYNERVMINYSVETLHGYYSDISNYNGEYFLDTAAVEKVTQKIYYKNEFGEVKDSSIVALAKPFKDSVIQSNFSTYYATITFVVGNRALINKNINVIGELGSIDVATDDYGTIVFSSKDVGVNIRVSTNLQQYQGLSASYTLDNYLVDTLTATIKPTIYPNPLVATKSRFVYINYENILLQESESINDYVNVYTSLGKRIENMNITYDYTNNRYEIDMSKLSSGIYYFKIDKETFKLLYIK